jgi:hypothetical protein
VTKEYEGKLQTVIEDPDLPNPVIRSHYGSGFVKQYVRDDRLLRTEPATNSVYDYGVNKDVENPPPLLANGKRLPGLKLDHPRQLAVMHSLVRLADIAAGGSFTTADLYAPALDAFGLADTQYPLASFRYDLSELRAKGLAEKVPHSRRYRLVGKGYSICVVFLKLLEKVYAPLTAGLIAPFRCDHI